MEQKDTAASREKSVSEKNRLLTSTVHEIRTPIQTIIGTLELLSETSLDKEQIEYVRQIQFSADVLLNLANDILDFSKLQSGKFKIEHIPFNAAELAEHVVDLISIEAHNRGLEIVTDIDFSLPQFIYGDPTRTQQVLLNLIKNAVKFTPKGYVRIRLSLAADNNLLYEVFDSGIGIPEEKRKELFHDFYQVDDSTTRKYGGTGLGLSISRKLIGSMNGTIGMRENPGGGSVFWFTLPCNPVPKECIPDNAYRKNTLSRALPYLPPQTCILVVDDNETARNSLRKKLLILGVHTVDTAASGTEALDKLHAAAATDMPFTVAFIDMIMPNMDGWRLSSVINADKTINSTKLFLMVPEGQIGGDAKMKMLDWFNGYLYKPVKHQKLAELLFEECEEPLDLEVVENDDLSPAASAPDAANGGKNGTAKSRTAAQVAVPVAGAPQIPVFTGKILVAEDHPVNRKLICTFLEQTGATVLTAENGEEAVSRAAQNPDIAVIFMDIQMPVKDGIEATKEIRSAGFAGIIIACTANTDGDDFPQYSAAGMNNVLIKPFKKHDIHTMIQNIGSGGTQ